MPKTDRCAVDQDQIDFRMRALRRTRARPLPTFSRGIPDARYRSRAVSEEQREIAVKSYREFVRRVVPERLHSSVAKPCRVQATSVCHGH